MANGGLAADLRAAAVCAGRHAELLAGLALRPRVRRRVGDYWHLFHQARSEAGRTPDEIRPEGRTGTGATSHHDAGARRLRAAFRRPRTGLSLARSGGAGVAGADRKSVVEGKRVD